jgi:mycothiol synthase
VLTETAAPRDLTWSPLDEAAIPAWQRMLAATERVDRTGEHFSADDLTEELADPTLDVPRRTIALTGPDGEMAAYGIVHVPRTIRECDRVWLEGVVRSDRRGQGIGRALLAWLEERAVEAHRERFPDVPGEFDVSPFEHVAPHVRLAERAGYRPARWFTTMRRELSGSGPVPDGVPDGLRLVPFDRAYDDAVRRAHNEAFADHWGSSERDAEVWAHWFTGQRAFRPASSFLVLDGEDVAGYLLSYFWAADAEATGVREGYVGQLGVRPAWRGRGLASALLGRALVAYREEGYDRAGLDVDTENATGALGLYARHGFAVTTRRVTYLKPMP